MRSYFRPNGQGLLISQLNYFRASTISCAGFFISTRAILKWVLLHAPSIQAIAKYRNSHSRDRSLPNVLFY